MIWYGGAQRSIERSPYNGPILGFLVDGILRPSRPRGFVIHGHFNTEEGVIVIVRRKRKLLCISACLALILLVACLWPRQEYRAFQVTFAEAPYLQDDILYCNVVNESDMTVTVQFLDAANVTMVYTLSPGETLPYVLVEFTPTTIRYNGKHDFSLEVIRD